MANNKKEITQKLLELLPDSTATAVDQAMTTWYMNIRPQGGMRLTAIGYTVLKTLDLESWTVTLLDVKRGLSKKLLLDLDHKLQWPYYIDVKKKQLIFFSSREAMMANLYGDLQAFLKQYS
jgi:hypothetical protein